MFPLIMLIAQWACIIAGIALGGVGTKAGGALILLAFAFFGAFCGYRIRTRINGR